MMAARNHLMVNVKKPVKGLSALDNFLYALSYSRKVDWLSDTLIRIECIKSNDLLVEIVFRPLLQF